MPTLMSVPHGRYVRPEEQFRVRYPGSEWGTAVNEPFVGADDKLANGALLRVAV